LQCIFVGLSALFLSAADNNNNYNHNDINNSNNNRNCESHVGLLQDLQPCFHCAWRSNCLSQSQALTTNKWPITN
jgi:hypothetical protein